MKNEKGKHALEIGKINIDNFQSSPEEIN